MSPSPAPATGAAPAPSAVRQPMAAAASRIRRLKRVDRLAVGVVTFGGIAIIAAVLGILVFIAAEAVPLFRSARVTPIGAVPVDTALAAGTTSLRAVCVDEYRRYLYVVEPDGPAASRTPRLATNWP